MTDFDYEIKDFKSITPLPDVILVFNMEYGEKTLSSGIIIPDDNGKESGIRPRFGIVYAVGSNIDYIKPGEKVLVKHGRWSRGIKIKESNGNIIIIRRVDPDDILLACE